MIFKKDTSPDEAGQEKQRTFKPELLRLLSRGVSYTLGVIRKRWYWLLAVIAITALLAFILTVLEALLGAWRLWVG